MGDSGPSPPNLPKDPREGVQSPLTHCVLELLIVLPRVGSDSTLFLCNTAPCHPHAPQHSLHLQLDNPKTLNPDTPISSAS